MSGFNEEEYDWNTDPEPETMHVPASVLPNPEGEQHEELDEVERRLEKAHFYRMLLRHQLISSDSNEAVEVEEEIQDFVRERLAILLGMKMEKTFDEAPTFTPEEIEALRAVAAKVLNRPAIVQARPEAPKAAPTIKPVQEAPKPAVRPAQSRVEPPKPTPVVETLAPKRRTRQRRAIATENLQKSVTPPTPSKAEKAQESDGTEGGRIEIVGAKRYKVIDRVVNDPATGQPKLDKNGKPITAEYRMDITPKTDIPGKQAFPSVEIMNAMEAAKAQESLSMNPLAAALVPTAMTLPANSSED